MTQPSKSATAPEPSPPRARPESPLERLRGAPLTCALAIANAIVFLVAEHSGSTRETGTLLRFGANERLHVWVGEWWRLGSHMFLHIGLMHIAWNTYASWGWCASVERALGGRRFLTTYLIAGVGGGCASVLGHDMVSAGASGALFGIIGARLVLERRASADWSTFFARPTIRSTFTSVGIWFVLGMTALSMDNFAHLGGLLTGIAVASLLTARIPVGAAAPALAALTMALTGVAMRPWHRTPDAHEVDILAWYGAQYLTGQTLTPNPQRAERFLRVACEAGSAPSCAYLGDALRAKATPEAEGEAFSLFMRACDGGDAQGCWGAGYALHEGRGVAADLPGALSYYLRGCDGNEAGACADAAGMLTDGKGVPRDDARSAALFRRACAVGNAHGCAGYARAQLFGLGVEKDETAGRDGLRRACEQGDTWACDALGRLTPAP